MSIAQTVYYVAARYAAIKDDALRSRQDDATWHAEFEAASIRRVIRDTMPKLAPVGWDSAEA